MFQRLVVVFFLCGGTAFFEQAPTKKPLAQPAAKPPAAARAAPTCDRLAAHPNDPKKPASVAGVADAAILPAAIEACAREVQASPQSARLKFQLGRALWAAKKYDEALEAFLQAEDMDYAAAAYYLGLAYEQGRIEGEKADLAAAADLYMIAAAEGFAPAVEAYQGIEWDISVDFAAFKAANYMRMLYGNDFKQVTEESGLKSEYERELMSYIVGIQNFLSPAPNEYEPSCSGAADRSVSESLQRWALREFNIPEKLSGNVLQDAAELIQRMDLQKKSLEELNNLSNRYNRIYTANQYGTDDIYALVADYGGCGGAPFKQLYSNLRTFVLARERAGVSSADGAGANAVRPAPPAPSYRSLPAHHVEGRFLANPGVMPVDAFDIWFEQIPMSREDRAAHISAIDPRRRPSRTVLKPGEKLECWILRAPGAGCYFVRPGTDPKTLPLDLENRELQEWEVVQELEGILVTTRTLAPHPALKSRGLGGPGGGQYIVIPFDAAEKLRRIK
jgi:TPR repeat protein